MLISKRIARMDRESERFPTPSCHSPLTLAVPRNFFALFFLSLRSFRPALSFFLASARPNCVGRAGFGKASGMVCQHSVP